MPLIRHHPSPSLFTAGMRTVKGRVRKRQGKQIEAWRT